jgi:ribosomal protein S16
MNGKIIERIGKTNPSVETMFAGTKIKTIKLRINKGVIETIAKRQIALKESDLTKTLVIALNITAPSKMLK